MGRINRGVKMLSSIIDYGTRKNKRGIRFYSWLF